MAKKLTEANVKMDISDFNTSDFATLSRMLELAAQADSSGMQLQPGMMDQGIPDPVPSADASPMLPTKELQEPTLLSVDQVQEYPEDDFGFDDSMGSDEMGLDTMNEDLDRILALSGIALNESEEDVEEELNETEGDDSEELTESEDEELTEAEEDDTEELTESDDELDDDTVEELKESPEDADFNAAFEKFKNSPAFDKLLSQFDSARNDYFQSQGESPVEESADFPEVGDEGAHWGANPQEPSSVQSVEDYHNYLLGDEGHELDEGSWTGAIGGAAKGAIAGAELGSIVGPEGTVAGAAIGGVAGGINGYNDMEEDCMNGEIPDLEVNLDVPECDIDLEKPGISDDEDLRILQLSMPERMSKGPQTPVQMIQDEHDLDREIQEAMYDFNLDEDQTNELSSPGIGDNRLFGPYPNEQAACVDAQKEMPGSMKDVEFVILTKPNGIFWQKKLQEDAANSRPNLEDVDQLDYLGDKSADEKKTMQKPGDNGLEDPRDSLAESINKRFKQFMKK